MRKRPSGPAPIQRTMSRLVLPVVISAALFAVVLLLLMTAHTMRYNALLHNVTTASEFNQDFKSSIDQKMYYYVIDSRYSEGLPLDEVEAAQKLARELLNTTTQRESRLAISSVLRLCENLEEKIYQIRDTESYDERQTQLENNINVITSLIQEYMYNYLYYEAVQLNALQQAMQARLVTELVLLQAQINPHFLYNTMDTIIWLIEAGKNPEATQMVSDLSNFFHHSLSKGQDIITLAEEESQVRSYLQIQQARYADILRYTIDLPERFGAVRIPKLTLQPLVENALYHGIKMKRGMGHIYILARQEGDDIVLQVTDDGAGMSAQRLQQLLGSMEAGKRVGFGLSAIHERLKLFFGEGYGLTIHSREGVGTTVFVRIPRESQKEESGETHSVSACSGGAAAVGLQPGVVPGHRHRPYTLFEPSPFHHSYSFCG